MGKKQNKAKKSSIVPKIILVLIMLAIIILYKAAFVLLLLGMLPTIVANYADTTSTKMGATKMGATKISVTKIDATKMRVYTIFCCNLAGLLPYFIPFAQNGGSSEELIHRVSDYNMWIIIYGMAACGYGLIKLCPTIYHGFLRVSYASKAFQAQQKQDALLKEWGDDVANIAAVTAK